jgi:pantetheine-phosphate adenylyltransferase
LADREPLIAVYPGTFDPITNGHEDVIRRGSRIYDKLIVAVAENAEKEPLFSRNERVDLIEAVVGDLPNVEIDSFTGLSVEYVHQVGAKVMFRGIRTVSDFEYEYHLALINRAFAGDVETLFVMPCEEYSFITSRRIREAVKLGADVSTLVNEKVEKALKKKLAKGK